MENITLLLGGEGSLPEQGVLFGVVQEMSFMGQKIGQQPVQDGPWAELLYPKLETKLAKELGDAALQKAGCPLSWGTICQVSEKSHPTGCVSVSVHEADKKKPAL